MPPVLLDLIKVAVAAVAKAIFDHLTAAKPPDKPGT